jgi:L-threonylcarbamoyladenylate synthase
VSDEAVAALRAGEAVVLPTDTVYGLCVDAANEKAAEKLYLLKQRPEAMPVAFVAAALDAVFEAVPELRGRAELLGALLPGPYTLVVPNPARRFRWLCGANPDAIGIRVPDLPAVTRAVLEDVRAVAATSANLHGEPDPARVNDISDKIRRGVAAVVDAGELPGTPSTVVDLTGVEPRVLREGAVPAAEVLKKIE